MINELRERKRLLKTMESLDKTIQAMGKLNKYAKLVDELWDAREIIANTLQPLSR